MLIVPSFAWVMEIQTQVFMLTEQVLLHGCRCVCTCVVCLYVCSQVCSCLGTEIRRKPVGVSSPSNMWLPWIKLMLSGFRSPYQFSHLAVPLYSSEVRSHFSVWLQTCCVAENVLNSSFCLHLQSAGFQMCTFTSQKFCLL